VLRGLVVTESDRRGARGSLERHLALWRARPDFLAYDIRDLPSGFAAAQRAKGLPVLTWTCRSVADWARAGEHADQIIYEEPAR
ncbi:MAG TPA: glycerophosphodiester phosphodiesterase, partial [Allosphingosinicella sp.]|nr:glycerophosphodiester phosphodiesterase [Allosphingosinicella sp.]